MLCSAVNECFFRLTAAIEGYSSKDSVSKLTLRHKVPRFDKSAIMLEKSLKMLGVKFDTLKEIHDLALKIYNSYHTLKNKQFG